MKLIGKTFSEKELSGFSKAHAHTNALDTLYAERDAAFKKVQQAKEALGKAENELWAIKERIKEQHRKAGQRG